MGKQINLPQAGNHGQVNLQSVVTGLWVLLALPLPLYRVLPGAIANLWTYGSLGMIVLVLLLARGSKPKWPGVWLFAGAASLVAGVVSSGTSGLAATMPVALQFFVLVGLGPFALRGSVTRDPRLLTRVSVSFTVAQTVSSIVGVLQLLGVSVLGYSAVYGRSPGLAGHPNVLGVMGSIAVLLCTHVLVTKSRMPRLWVIVALAINTAGLLSTGSLSSMFACAFGVLFVLWVNRVRIAKVLWALAVGLCGLWAALLNPGVAQYFRSPADRFFQVTGQTDDVSTLEIRLNTFQAAWTRIQIDPFMGKGIDSGQSASYGSTAVHNLFLHAWYQGGLALAAAMACILIAVLVFLVHALRARSFALAAGILVTVLSYALTSAFFEQAYYWLPVIVAWASLSTHPITRKPREVREKANSRGAAGLVHKRAASGSPAVAVRNPALPGS